MTRRTSLAWVLLVALLSGGCGTVDNLQRPGIAPADNPNAPVCRVYGGVRGDWVTMTEYPWSETTSYLDYAVIPILAAGNLFFTGIGDTVTLPYTAVEEARRAFRRPDASANFVPVADPVPVTTPERASATPPPPRPAPDSHVGR